MVYQCDLNFCKKNSSSRKPMIHKTPRTFSVFIEWKKAIIAVQPNFKFSKLSKICSLHFVESDYNISSVSKKKTLKSTAVPSVFTKSTHKMFLSPSAFQTLPSTSQTLPTTSQTLSTTTQISPSTSQVPPLIFKRPPTFNASSDSSSDWHDTPILFSSRNEYLFSFKDIFQENISHSDYSEYLTLLMNETISLTIKKFRSPGV